MIARLPTCLQNHGAFLLYSCGHLALDEHLCPQLGNAHLGNLAKDYTKHAVAAGLVL